MIDILKKHRTANAIAAAVTALSLIWGMLFFKAVPVRAESSVDISGNQITISGQFDNPAEGEEVTIDVYYPGKTFADLLIASPKDYTSILLYRDEMPMESNGVYSFRFNVGDIPSGRYTAYIARSGSDEIRTETVYYINPNESTEVISSAKFGNIFYADDAGAETPVFNIRIPVIIDCRDATVEYTVRTFENEVVLKKKEIPSAQTYSYRIDDFNKFGQFELTVRIYSNGVLVESDVTDFSVIRRSENKNPKVNIHELLGNDREYYPYIEDIMEVFSNSGFAAARTSISRNGVSWSGDSLTYQPEYQKMMQYYSSSDMGAMILLGGSNSVWNHMPVTDDEIEDFRRYCARVAIDTKDYAFAYEVCNEPDTKAFNKDDATPAQYAKLIKVASEAIKSVKPEAKIVAVSTSCVNNSYVQSVIDGAKDQGFDLADYIDAIGVHPYAWGSGPVQANTISGLQSIRELMKNNGLSDKELWVTEFGWQRTIGLDRQAQHTMNYLLLCDAAGVVDKTFFFRYAATMPAENNEEFGFLNDGAADVPFSARPQMVAAANYNRIMGGAVFDNKKLTINGTDVYKFKLADGRDAAVYYSENANSAIDIDLGAQNVTFCDIYGNETQLFSDNGIFSLDTADGVNYAIGSFTKFEEASYDSEISVSKDVTEELEQVKLSVETEYDIEISTSGNVSVYNDYNTGNKHGYSFCVNNFGAEKPYVEVELKDDGRTMCVRRFKIKESPGRDVIFRMDRYNYSGYYAHRVYNMDYSVERKQAFRLTGTEDSVSVLYNAKQFELPDANGKYKVSFDFSADKARNFGFVLGSGDTANLNTENQLAAMYINENGDIGYYSKRYYQSGVASDIKFQPDKWYRFEAIIDISKKNIEYYLDSQKIGEITVLQLYNYPLSDFCSLRFINSSATSGTMWIDNIEVSQMNTTPFEINVSASGFEITANETAVQALNGSDSASVLYAVYDSNNDLLKTEIVEVSKNTLQNDYANFKISSDIPVGASRLKVFILEDTVNIRPLVTSMSKIIK